MINNLNSFKSDISALLADLTLKDAGFVSPLNDEIETIALNVFQVMSDTENQPDYRSALLTKAFPGKGKDFAEKEVFAILKLNEDHFTEEQKAYIDGNFDQTLISESRHIDPLYTPTHDEDVGRFPETTPSRINIEDVLIAKEQNQSPLKDHTLREGYFDSGVEGLIERDKVKSLIMMD